jgi:hypothetical protein
MSTSSHSGCGAGSAYNNRNMQEFLKVSAMHSGYSSRNVYSKEHLQESFFIISSYSGWNCKCVQGISAGGRINESTTSQSGCGAGNFCINEHLE